MRSIVFQLLWVLLEELIMEAGQRYTGALKREREQKREIKKNRGRE